MQGMWKAPVSNSVSTGVYVHTEVWDSFSLSICCYYSHCDPPSCLIRHTKKDEQQLSTITFSDQKEMATINANINNQLQTLFITITLNHSVIYKWEHLGLRQLDN